MNGGTLRPEDVVLRTTYTKSGLARYEAVLSHEGLNKVQLFKGENPDVLRARVSAKAAEWDEMWARRVEADIRREERAAAAQEVEEKRLEAAELTAEATQAIDSLRNLMESGIAASAPLDWESLKDRSPYAVPQPEKPACPAPPVMTQVPAEPGLNHPDFRPKMSLLDHLGGARKRARIAEAQRLFETAHDNWAGWVASAQEEYRINCANHAAEVARLEEAYAAALAAWHHDAEEFLAQQARANAIADERQAAYMDGNALSITYYCNKVLERSSYPEYFPKDFELEYNPTNKVVIVDYQLPVPSDLPTTAEVKYVATRDEFSEKPIPMKQLSQLYDDALYQTALRTVHELLEADAANGIAAVNFNGWVQAIDPSTGLVAESCILSLQVTRAEFECVNLSNVDPKACFKKLKGVSASKLHSLTPVAPLLSMSREDRRFVDSYSVADSIVVEDNLAAMDWEDFEHLIRELFEKEYATSGAEVKVTQASRDGGVDAVIFDPDPIHGGKTVVQAKRYTNTVGVSAVRDLFGTMMSEGANKGILVTTSDYGPDAYSFANGKPLVLLSGGNLLHLLAKHGHQARIDLTEAKRILASRE